MAIAELARDNRVIAAHIAELTDWQSDAFAHDGDADMLAGIIQQLQILAESNRRTMRRLLWSERFAGTRQEGL